MPVGRVSLVLVATSMSLALGACTSVHVRTHRATPVLADLPPPQPISTTAGVITPAGLVQATHTRSNASYRWVVPIGLESTAMFQAAWPRLFTGVVPVPAGAPTPAGVDLLLEPSLESFDFFLDGEEPRQGDAVVYRFDLSAPGGPLVASWAVRGRVPFRPRVEATAASRAATASPFTPDQSSMLPDKRFGWDHAADNIDDAARTLLATFRERSRIEAYLARRAAGGSFALPLDGVTLEATATDQIFDLPGGTQSLVALGVVPVRVRVANGGTRPLPVEALVARLELPGGASFRAAGATRVVERLDLASTLASEPPALLAGPLATVYWVARESEKRALLPVVRAALEARTLRPGIIGPGEAIEGYLFFALPTAAAGPRAGTLTISLADDDLHGGALVTSVAGLPAVSLRPPKVKREEPTPGY